MAEQDDSFSEWEHISSPTHSTASNNQVQENTNSSSSDIETISSDSEDNNLEQNELSLASEVMRHVRVNFEALCTKVVERARFCGSCKMGFGQFVSLSGVMVAVVASLMYMRMRKLVKMFKEREGQLNALIISKDEKIRQLVVQLAYMNDLLVGRRKVPVVRIHQYSRSA